MSDLDERLRWVARGVFDTTEGAPTNGGGLDQHLLAVYGQGQDEAPNVEAVQEYQEKAPDADIHPTVAEPVSETVTSEEADGDEGQEFEQHVEELITPPLVAEVFGTSPFIDATPVKEKAQKRPAKKKPSSK